MGASMAITGAAAQLANCRQDCLDDYNSYKSDLDGYHGDKYCKGVFTLCVLKELKASKS
jgi:hypothetical protein